MGSHCLNFGTILVATDTRGGSASAIHYAQALAGRHGSKLILADVVDPVSYAFERGEAGFLGTDRGRSDDIERILSDVRVRGMLANSIPGRRAVCAQILESAEEHSADVLVLGTRADDAISRMALGRVARELLGSANCTMITVAGRADVFVPSAGMPRRVVAATDLTRGSLAALRLAQPMIHGSLTLLHAGQCRNGHDCLNTLERLRTESPSREWRAMQVEHAVVQGEAGAAIVEYARKQNADLVVLASPEKLQDASLVSSSTVFQVIAGVSCPVMCIPSGEADAGERPLPVQGTVTYSAAGRHVA